MHDSVWKMISLLQQAFILLHFVLMITFAVRVLMKRLPVGVSLAWLLVLALLPYVGVGLYLLFGERYLGVHRNQRRERLQQAQEIPALRSLEHIKLPWHQFHPASLALAKLEFQTAGIPALGGNDMAFIDNAQATIDSLCADIHAAQHHCHMEFYIWYPGGIADAVADALVAAAARGVRCRIMLDAVGSKAFFKSDLVKQLQHTNIELIKACPIRLMPAKLARYDLRSHRKTVVIDNRIAYIGSFNLIDPSRFKQSQGVGEWIDLMARIEGPLVQAIDAVFRWYWNLETQQKLPLLEQQIEIRRDKTVAQVAPSGPDSLDDSILQSLLQAIYSATRQVDIVTPYFVPGEALEQALIIAARRGVQVNLILPARVDSFLARHAGHSYFDQLMAAGVHIYQFERGLLHTKCVIIDQQLAFFGTVNMDLRSLWLNFEMTLIIYDKLTARRLAQIMDTYRSAASSLDKRRWQARGRFARLLENITHLFSPLI